MKQLIAAALLLSAVSIPASAQSLVNDARIEALADLIAYAEPCDLSFNQEAVGRFLTSEFQDSAEALNAMRTNMGLAKRNAERSTDIDRMVTCPLLKQFASTNELLQSN